MRMRELSGWFSAPAALLPTAALLPIAALLLIAGCGSDSGSGSGSGASTDDPGSGSQTGAEDPGAGSESNVELTLDGVHELLSGGARLEVREENPVVNLKVTAVFASNHDDLVQLQLALDGVANAMGYHRSELSGDANAAASAVAYLEQVSYSSQSGSLEVTLKNDHTLDGRFDALLSADPVTGGDPAAMPVAAADFEISGSFSGTWSLVCRSPVPVLPGDHSVSDSPYCNNLTF